MVCSSGSARLTAATVCCTRSTATTTAKTTTTFSWCRVQRLPFTPVSRRSEIDAAIADDPEAATSEWEATFRSDLASFLDEATIEAAIDRDRPLELPPRAHQYSAFVDPSGGRHDAFTICIGHEEDESFVADVVRGTKPPFDPQEVVKSYAALLKEYGVTEVTGDGSASPGSRPRFRTRASPTSAAS